VQWHGPAFPSFKEANRGRTSTPRSRTGLLPAGTQWAAHTNTRAQLRNLRRVCRPVLDAIDPDTVAARQRVIAATAGEPSPEFGALHLMYAALDASRQTGESWPVCLHYLLDKLEAMPGPPIPMSADG
jgi:hypothetical protein